MKQHECHRQKCFLLFVFLISSLIFPCLGKSGGHGGGGGHGGSSTGGRGSSAARGSGGSRGSTSIGHSIGTGPGHFGSGTGLGSASRAESFKSSFVSSPAANTYYHNQPFYYYGNHYYLGGHGASKVNAGEIKCKMPLDTLFNQNASLSNSSKLINETLSAMSNETWPATGTNGTFSMTNGTWPAIWTNGTLSMTNGTWPAIWTNGTLSMTNETWPAKGTNGTLSMTNGTWPAIWTNGTRPKHIVWTCKKHVEQCCGIECCPTSAAEGANDGTAVVEIVFIVLGGVIIMVWYWVIQNFDI